MRIPSGFDLKGDQKKQSLCATSGEICQMNEAKPPEWLLPFSVAVVATSGMLLGRYGLILAGAGLIVLDCFMRRRRKR